MRYEKLNLIALFASYELIYTVLDPNNSVINLSSVDLVENICYTLIFKYKSDPNMKIEKAPIDLLVIRQMVCEEIHRYSYVIIFSSWHNYTHILKNKFFLSTR